MKKILMILMVIACLSGQVYALTYGADNYKNNISVALTASRNDPIKNFMTEVESKISGETGTGSIFYVDSATDGATGLTWATAVGTLQEAINLGTDNAGDIVYVAAGHEEDLATAAVLLFDCPGMTVIGFGSGDEMPEFSLTALASTVSVTAPDVTIYNLRFLGDFATGSTLGLDVQATGDGFRVFGCEFRSNSNNEELLIALNVTAAANNLVIAGNSFVFETGGTESSAIVFEGASNKTVIYGNRFDGDWSGYVIDASGATSVQMLIEDNVIHNMDTGAGGTMTFAAASTGDIIRNVCYGNHATGYIPVGNAMFISPENVFMGTENVETRNYETMFGPFTGAAGGAAGTTIFADMVLAQTDLDAIIVDVGLWNTGTKAKTLLFGSDTAGATASAVSTVSGNVDSILVDTGTDIPASLSGITTAIASIDATGFAASATSDPASTAIVECTTLAGFGNDYFNTGWSLRCMLDLSGAGTAPEGETWDIIDYVSATGTFTVNAAFTVKVTTGDSIWVFRTEELNLDDKTMLGCAGTIRYVDSGTSGDGSGLTLENAYATVALAEAALSAGDVVYIADGHDEEIGDLLINVANVSFIGLGEGDARPLLTLNDNTDEITIDAAGVTMKNIRIQSGVTACVKAFYIDDAGIGVTLDNISFIDGEASTVDEFVDVIQVNAAASNLTVKNCTYYSLDATGHTNSFLDLGEVTIDSPTIEGCRIFGKFAEAPVWGGAAAVPVNVLIKDNIISNTTTGQFCIEFTGAATGMCVGNRLYSDSYATTLNPGSLKCIDNIAVNAIDTSGVPIPEQAARIESEHGTGLVFFVDSGAAAGGSGLSWSSAVQTMDEAIGLCTADRGDTIYVAQGHYEVEAAAASIFTLDIEGVSVIGVSNGTPSGVVATGVVTGTDSQMPVFVLDHVDATVTISAANCRLQGVRIESDLADVKNGLTMSNASDGSVVEGCFITDGASDEELLVGILVAADADAIQLINNTLSTVVGGGCTHGIHLAGGCDNSIIKGNRVHGTYATGAFIASAAPSVNTLIEDNVFITESAIVGCALSATTTGYFAHNFIGSAETLSNTLTGDTVIWCHDNWVSGAPGASGVISPAVDSD